MKSTKEIVYEFIQKTTVMDDKYKNGIATNDISDALDMQRSNVSSLLNELVKEEKLLKTKTRPVLYQVVQIDTNERLSENDFKLIGGDGSLKNAIQLAKAAILYPKKSLDVLLSSKSGCGTTHFASMMYMYAKETQVINSDAPYVKINCEHYERNIDALNLELYGYGEPDKSAFKRAQGGMLFIDNFDLLNGKQQSLLFEFVETGKLFVNMSEETSDLSDLILVISCSPTNALSASQRIAVTIELPELSKRPIQERFDLINYFFSVEASNSKRTVETSLEVIQALLLSEFTFNVKELELEIKSACANAYVRVVNEGDKRIEVVVDDFKSGIKRNLLKQKKNRADIFEVVGSKRRFVYDSLEGYLGAFSSNKQMYEVIDQQYKELYDRGVNDSSIEDIINAHITSLFKKYRYHYQKNDSDGLEQLSKIVDDKIIEMVQSFLVNAEQILNRKFPSNVIYGLCLHINSLASLNISAKRLDNDQIVDVIQNYPQEYALSMQFCELLKSKLNLVLPIDEIVLITMFIVEQDKKEEQDHPVLLYILHGQSTASSLRDVTNSLTHCRNAYSYDLTLDTNTDKALEEIKNLILKIDTGGGVIVIYDMGSIKTMLDTLNEQLNIKIRYMNIPITLLGIEVARRCLMETNIDSVYHQTSIEFNRFSDRENKNSKVILTLCHTGEGGAIQIKNFIDQHSKLGFQTIPLAISDKDELLRAVMDIRRAYSIHAFVGTYDPQLLGIPFIPISKIFENDGKVLDSILTFKPVTASFNDYAPIYKYFEDNFKYANIAKIKSTLPTVMDQLSVFYDFDDDQYLGLFVHIACMVERILDGKQSPLLKQKDDIISRLPEDYEAVAKVMKQFERKFKIIIDDNEIATMIMIIKKL